MSQETELLKKLYDFYSKRYSKNKTQMEDKFNDSIVDLIETGDVKKATYYEFCVDNDIEPRKLEKPAVPRPTIPVDRPALSYDPCSRGGGYLRSSC